MDNSITVPRLRAHIPGYQLAREGDQVARELWPNANDRYRDRPRLNRLYREYIDDADAEKRAIGFFLFGLSGGLRGCHA